MGLYPFHNNTPFSLLIWWLLSLILHCMILIDASLQIINPICAHWMLLYISDYLELSIYTWTWCCDNSPPNQSPLEGSTFLVCFHFPISFSCTYTLTRPHMASLADTGEYSGVFWFNHAGPLTPGVGIWPGCEARLFHITGPALNTQLRSWPQLPDWVCATQVGNVGCVSRSGWALIQTLG